MWCCEGVLFIIPDLESKPLNSRGIWDGWRIESCSQKNEVEKLWKVLDVRRRTYTKKSLYEVTAMKSWP